MSIFNFKGGVHPPGNKKFTESKKIENYNTSNDVVLFLSQHIGSPSEPIVKVGDYVLAGEKIAKATGFISSPIHSSVSGTVKKISKSLHTNGLLEPSITIENDGEFKEFVYPKYPDYKSLTKDEIVSIVNEAGIVGLGGATFPTYVKLIPPKEDVIDSIIINAVECEPYLTLNHRLMLENTKEIVESLDILHHIYKDIPIKIGIEDNKQDAIDTLTKETSHLDYVEVYSLKTLYPQGGEKQLIYSLTGKMIPSGKLPSSIGCIVLNINTLTAIRDAVVLGKPLTEKIVTISGSIVKNPSNVKVKIGTHFDEIINFCGGLTESAAKIISGGPMTGSSLVSTDTHCVKGTSALIFFSKKGSEIFTESNCIRCGRCLNVCPIRLNPTDLNAYQLDRNYDDFEFYNGLDCIECGACSYICPAKRHLAQSIRVGKATVLSKRKKVKK